MNSTLVLPVIADALSHLASFGSLLAQAADDNLTQPTQMNPVAGAISGIVGLALAVVGIVSMWKIFTKAGQPGWASIIPIYNFYIMCKVAGKPGWWLVLMLVPFVNFVIAILVIFGLAKNFGKGAGFGLGILFLGFIFLPILAFGDARYQGAPPPLV